MLEFEIAAIYYFVKNTLTATPYFQQIPVDMLIPCVFYPTPQVTSKNFSLSTFALNFLMYAKVFAIDTLDAYTMASKILVAVMKNGNKIPLYNENGSSTGKNLRINNPVIKKIDECVYQIEFSWVRYTAVGQVDVARAEEIYVNINPVESDGKEE